MFELAVLFLGLLAGVMSGLFGIGGGIVMVPALIAFFGMGMLDANAVSLAAMLLPVGVLGVITYYKAGLIQIKESLWISAGLLVGSYFGAELAVSVDISLLSKLYAMFLLYVVLNYFDVGRFLRIKKANKQSSNELIKPERAFWQFIVLGLFAGVIAGMFGKGGGIVIVPMLTHFFHYETKNATATSLAALQLPVGLPSVIVYAQNGHLNLLYASLMAAGIVVGVFVGSKAAIKLPSEWFKKIYALFLAGVAVYMVMKFL